MRSILKGLILSCCCTLSLAGGWVASGPEGGRASALVFHPQDPDILYAAGPNGVFKSADLGKTWSRTSEGLTDCRLTDLVVHPRRPQVLFAASREGGVFKSMDGGESWSAASQGIFEPRIHDLEFDPSNPDVIYAATRNGVFKSSDGGETWADRSQGFLFDFFIQRVTVAPSDPDVVYASSPFGGIYKSLDGGQSWQLMPRQQGFGFNGELAVHPLQPDHLFAGSDVGISITLDGQSWENVCILFSSVTGECVARSSLAMVFEDDQGQSLLLGTENGPRRMNVATREIELLPVRSVRDITPRVETLAASPAAIAAALVEGVVISQDQGLNWRLDTAGFRMNPASHPAVDPLNPMRAYVATEAGPWKTLDGGQSWVPVRLTSTTLFSRQLFAVYTSPFDLGETRAVTNSGSERVSLDEGGTWRNGSFSGPGGTLRQLAPDYAGRRVLAVTSFGVTMSVDGRWDFINEGLDGVNRRGLGLDRTADRLWLASEDGLFTRIIEEDDPWLPAGSQPPDPDLWSVALSEDGQMVLAGSESGLFISRDGGSAWTLAEDVPRRRVTSIMIDEGSRRILAATWGEGVWRSQDGGLSFDRCGEGLESGFVSGIAAGADRLYAATQGGLFILPADPPRPADPLLEVAVGGTDLENGISEVDLQLSLPQDAAVLDQPGFEMALSLDGRFQVVETDSSSGKLTQGPSPATLFWDGRLEPGQSVQMRVSLKVPDAFEDSLFEPFSVTSKAALLLDEDGDGSVERLIPSQPIPLTFALNSALLRRTLVVPGSSVIEDGFVGLALTNPSSRSEAAPQFTELSASGGQSPPPRPGEPLQPQAQRARQVEEFAEGNPDALAVGLSGQMKGFFLMGDNASQKLDGVGARMVDSELSFITDVRVGAGVETRLFIFNPDTENSAQVALSFADASGEALGQGFRELEPSASRMEPLRDLIAGLPLQAHGYLRLRSSGPVRAFALRDENDSFSTLAAAPPAGRRVVYMPHFVVDPSLGATTFVHLVNAAGFPAQALLRILCDDQPGLPIDFSIEVAGHGLLSLDLADLLPEDGLARQGSIELSLSGGDVAGFPLLVPFLASATIDGGLLGTRSSLPFSAGHDGPVLIQQLAHSPSAGIFQGLAVRPTGGFGIGNILIFDSTGSMVARSFFFVAEGQRLIGLLDEFNYAFLDPQLRENFDITGGWISIRLSDAAVVSLFGGPDFLSAVEPEPID